MTPSATCMAENLTMTSGRAVSHWLEVVSHLDPRYGGLSAVVPRLGLEMEHDGTVEVGLAAFCSPGEHFVPPGYEDERLSHWPVSRMAWLRDGSLRKRLRDLVRATDGLHVHGLWEQSTAMACGLARELGKPYVLSAHGMLEPWALKNKQLKKLLYAALSERANVDGAACLHALTRSEAVNYRYFGARGPIVVVPNGVTVPATLSSAAFLDAYPDLRERRILLFMSRLHPKKGLDLLVEAWANLAARWPEAQLVLAGPDFEGTQAKIEALVADRGLKDRVVFTGMLNAEMKWSALAAAECFLLPSHSEGLSMSALEAMGAGLPVIVTEQCNMPEVRTLDLGWEIDPAVGPLVSAMKDVLGNTPTTNREIGRRGRQLVDERYSWPTVARQMAEVYAWVLGGPEPDSVEVLRG